jgi:hypothetical protein
MQYNLLKKWGDYLVTNALIPAQEYFSFDFLSLQKLITQQDICR